MNLDFITPNDADRKIRVLLVDDIKSLLIIMERGLRSQGHVVYSPGSGCEALEIFKENLIDVIVCDMAMDERDGLEVSRTIQRICERQGIRKTPFILLTGWGELDRGETFEPAGVDLVIEKPADTPQLFEVIRSVTASRDCQVLSTLFPKYGDV